MVDVARYFMEFTHSESCGKCIPAAVAGSVAAHLTPSRAGGRGGGPGHLDEMGRMIATPRCAGWGQTAPNPLLTTMHGTSATSSRTTSTRNGAARACAKTWRSRLARQLPAAHEHPALPPALQGRTGWEEAFEAVVLDNPLPASTGGSARHPSRTAAAPDHRRIGEHARSAPVHRRRHLSIDRFDALAERIRPESCPPTDRKGGRWWVRPLGADRGFLPGALGTSDDIRFQRRARGMLRYALPNTGCPGTWCAARWI